MFKLHFDFIQSIGFYDDGLSPKLFRYLVCFNNILVKPLLCLTVSKSKVKFTLAVKDL